MSGETHWKARFRAIFESSAIGILVTDREGRCVEANPAVAAMLGRAPKELLDRSFSDLTHPDDRAADDARYRSLMAGEIRQYRIEKRYLRNGGGVAWGHVSVSAILDEAGEPAFAVRLIEDVTEVRAMRERLVQVQKLETVGRLAGGVAHDFNNLLQAVAGYAESALETLGRRHPAAHDLDEILRAADRAAALTRQLLAFSRRQVLAPEVLRLDAVVLDLSDMLARLLGERVQLDVHAEPRLWRVLADRSQIEQVVVNLAVNARDAMARGGVLTLETSNVELDDAYARQHPGVRPGPYVLLAVSDNGVGMTDEVRAHVFEPFFSTKSPGEGSGLGLATVHGIVHQSRGHVWCYSEPGRGTTFKIYLPRTDREGLAVSRPRPAAGAEDGDETLLVLEDEDAVRTLLRDQLCRHGYRVLAAGTVAEARETVARHAGRIDAVVSDVVLPDGHGDDFVRELRSSWPELRVLFMSGYTENAVAHHGVLDPGVEFLQKPYGMTELRRRIREILDDR